ncbi:MAG: DUF2244 domain-containing protein [Burkholderiales bacterium]
MEGSKAEPSADFVIIARPNCSLSPASRLLCLCVIASVAFGIALVFAWLGAWLVLPFAGLEVGVLVWAFRHIARHAQDYEKITLYGDRLMVECQNAGQISRYEFNRYWARVVLEPAHGEWRVALRSHGRQVAVGRHMNCTQRQALAKALRIRLSHKV